MWGKGDLFLVDTGVLDLPNRIHCANEIRGGNLPFWTDRIANGWSPMGENQTGIFYPMFLLYVLAPTPQTHDVFMAIHYLLAGVFAYIYLSRHFTPLAAMVGAVSYMAAPLLQRTHTVPSTIQIACWLPLCLLCIDLRLESGSKRALYSLALINTIMTFAGFPQLALTVFTLEVLYYLAMGGWRHPNRWIQDGAIAFLLAGLLSAPQNVPTYFFLKESSRAEAFNWEYFRSTATPIAFLLNGTVGQCVLNPQYSLSFDTRWIPLVASALILLGSLIIAWRRPYLRFWLIIGILGVLLATDTPLLKLVYYLPVYNWFRWHAVYLLFTTMGVTVLIAGVVEEVFQRIRSPRIQLIITGVLAAALSFHHMGFYLSDKPVYGQVDPSISDLRTSNAHFRLWPMAEAHSRAAEKGYFSSDTMLATARTACANYNLIQDIPVGRLIHQFQTVVTREFFDYYHPNRMSFREDLPTLIRGAANTHVSSDIKLSDSYVRNLDSIKDGPDVWLYEIQNPLPRAWMVYRTESIPGSSSRLARVSSIEFDAGQAAVTERKFPEFTHPTVPPEVRWKLLRPDAIQVDVDTETDGLLVVSDTWSPYFYAAIDGQKIAIERVNHTFRGIVIPTGKHSVVMYYWSAAFLLSVVVASIAAIVLTCQLLAGESILLVMSKYAFSAIFVIVALFNFVEVMRGPTAPNAESRERIGSSSRTHQNEHVATGDAANLPHTVLHYINLKEMDDDAKCDFDLTVDVEDEDTVRFEVRTTSGDSIIDEIKDYRKGVHHYRFSPPRRDNNDKYRLLLQSHRQLRVISLSQTQSGRDYTYASSDWHIEATFALAASDQEGLGDLKMRVASPTNQTLAVTVAEGFSQSSYQHLLHLSEGARTYSIPFAAPSRDCIVTVRGRSTWPFQIEEIGWKAPPKILPTIDLPTLEVQPPSKALMTQRGNNSFELNVIQDDEKNPWSAMLVKRPVKVETNRCLLATFTARSETPQVIPLVLARNEPPANAISPIRSLSLTSDWKKFRVPFISSASGMAQLQFQMGGAIGKYFIQNLEVSENPLQIVMEGREGFHVEQADDPEILRVRSDSSAKEDANDFVTIEYGGGSIRAGIKYRLQVRARSTVARSLSVELTAGGDGEMKSEYFREVPLHNDWVDIHADVLVKHSAAKSIIRLRWRREPGVVEFSIPEFQEIDPSTISH